MKPYSFSALFPCVDPSKEWIPLHFDDALPGSLVYRRHLLYNSRTMRHYNPSLPIDQEENSIRTFNLVKKAFDDFQERLTNFKPRHTQLSFEAKNGSLTTKEFQEFYRKIIEHHVRGIAKVALSLKPTKTIIFDGGYRKRSKQDDPEQTRKTVQVYTQDLIRKFGKGRVERACERQKINLAEKTTLYAQDVRQLTLAISDYYLQDLEEGWEAIKECIKENGLSKLPSKMAKKLGDLAPFESSVHLPFLELSGHLRDLIQNAVQLSSQELELAFLGERISGVIDGGIHNLKDKFIPNHLAINQQRLQLYQNIFAYESENKKEFFDEILAKAICKKELDVGMMIPSPWRKNVADTPSSTAFYYVKRRLATGKGKIAYQLEPIDQNNKKLSSFFVFRSTSTAPCLADTAGPLLSNLNPCAPPGYLWRKEGREIERKIYFDSQRHLRVLGHSLGGSLAQLSLRVNDIPDRKISIITFDSPKIRFSTALKFKNWAYLNRDLAARVCLVHWQSRGDIVPLAGENNLGSFIEEGILKKNHDFILGPMGKKNIFLQRRTHSRLYFHTKLGAEFTKEPICKSLIEKKSLRIVEIMRRILGFFFFPIVFIIHWIWKNTLGRDTPFSHFFNDDQEYRVSIYNKPQNLYI